MDRPFGFISFYKYLMTSLLFVSGGVSVEAESQDTKITFVPHIDVGINTSGPSDEVIPDVLYKDGVKITSTDARFALKEYDDYRFYKYSYTNFISTIGNLKEIVFTCSEQGNKNGSPVNLESAKSKKETFSSGRYKIDDYNKKVGIWTCSDNVNSLTINYIKGVVYATKIEVTVDKYPNTTTISSAGYATYCCDKAVDYTKTYGLVAYKAKYDSEKKMIVLTKVGKVPANTPVVLKGEGGLYGFPTLESAPKAVTDNDLKVATANMTCTDNMWILVKKSTGVGFVPATPGTTLAKGKCYLLIESGASSKFLPFDETTGISHISPNAVRSDGKTYNILGQEVGNDYKGIVIVDGKKVVRK